LLAGCHTRRMLLSPVKPCFTGICYLLSICNLQFAFFNFQLLLLFFNYRYGRIGAHTRALQTADACCCIIGTTGKYSPCI